MAKERIHQQKRKIAAAGQCLLIVLSFLPVWLMRAGEATGPAPAQADTLFNYSQERPTDEPTTTVRPEALPPLP